MTKKYFLFLLVIALALTITGCGGGKPKAEVLPTPTPTPAGARQLPGQLRFVSGNRILSTDGIRVEEVARGNYRRPAEYLVEVRGQVVVVQTGQTLFSEGVVSTWPAVSPPGNNGVNSWAVVQRDFANELDVLVCDGEVVFQALIIASPTFTDDGQWLAWATMTKKGGTLDLFVWKVGGREQPIPLAIPGANARHQLWPAWGDGGVLYFASGEGTDWDIFKIVLKSGGRIDEEVGVQRVTAHGDATNPTFYAGALAYQRCEEFNTRAGTLWPECRMGSTIWAIYGGVEMKITEGYDPSWFHPDRQQLPKLVAVMPTPLPTATPAVTPTSSPAATATQIPTPAPAVETAPTCQQYRQAGWDQVPSIVHNGCPKESVTTTEGRIQPGQEFWARETDACPESFRSVDGNTYDTFLELCDGAESPSGKFVVKFPSLEPVE